MAASYHIEYDSDNKSMKTTSYGKIYGWAGISSFSETATTVTFTFTVYVRGTSNSDPWRGPWGFGFSLWTGWKESGFTWEDSTDTYFNYDTVRSVSTSMTFYKQKYNRTIYLYLDMDSKTVDGHGGATTSMLFDSFEVGYVSIPAKAKYTVSYDANTGSAAPSAQTKWYGENITLSTTIPVKTGWGFVSWNTQSDGTGTNYNPGATFTSNANTTLYAIWEKLEWDISYDGNKPPNAYADVTGVPESTKKLYDTIITVGAAPTLQYYEFLGWNTVQDGSGTMYQPGDDFTVNLDTVFYAQWQVAYIPLTMSNFSAHRALSDGTDDDEGIYVHYSFNWSIDSVASHGVINPRWVFSYKLTTDEQWTTVSAIQLSGTSGLANGVVPGVTLSQDASFNVRIALQDSHYDGTSPNRVTGEVRLSQLVPTAYFTLDFKAGGKAIGIGKTAPDPTGHPNGYLDIKMDTNMTNVDVDDLTVNTLGVEDSAEIDTLTVTGNTTVADINISGDISSANKQGALADWVVARGMASTSRISNGTYIADAYEWVWEKWASGKAECWGKLKSRGVWNITSAWGSAYESTVWEAAEFPPGLFYENGDPWLCIPSLNYMTHGVMALERDASLHISETHTNSIFLVRPTAASNVQGLIQWHAKGWWKPWTADT